MVEVKLYRDENIHDLHFLAPHQELETLIIAPNPQTADEIRQKIINAGLHKIPEVITISKFIKDELSLIKSGDETIKNKAALLMSGASLWKNFALGQNETELNSELFFKGFTLFTELRGFSLDADVIAPVLDEYPLKLKQFVLYFYHIAEQLNFVDEHKAYRIIADYYRESELSSLTPTKNIVFWDFVYLSGSQLDLINALSTKMRVVIPYDKEIYFKTTSNDWIRWLLPEDKNLSSPEAGKSKKKLDIVEFPRKKLNIKLSEFSPSEKTTIVLCTKKLNEFEVFDIPYEGVQFKTSNSIFDAELVFAENLVREFKKNKNDLIETSALASFLGARITEELKASRKNFRRIKTLTDFVQLLENYFNLSELNRILSDFDLKVLFMVLRLNLPRTFFTPVIASEDKGQLLDLSRLSSVEFSGPVYVCASSEYAPIKMSEEVYHEKVFEILSSLGPVKRNGLDFLLTKKRLESILSYEKTILFLENGLLKHDLGWSEITSTFDLNFVKAKSSLAQPEKKISLIKNIKDELSTLSAHKLQTYLDCPQKYYFQYVNKLSVELDLPHLLESRDLGTLEHKVIEDYLGQYQTWDVEKFNALTLKILQTYLSKEEKLLSPTDFNHYYSEIKLLAGHGIQYLLDLKNIDPSVRFEFEKKLQFNYDGIVLNSIVDCIAYFKDGYAVFDFKRSKGGIPSKTDLFELKKIQVLFYLKFLWENDPNLLYFGYLNLSELEDSLLISNSDDMDLRYQSQENLRAIKLVPKKDDFAVLKSNFDQLWAQTLQMMQQETQYLAKPSEDSVCHYCVINNICSRRESYGNC